MKFILIADKETASLSFFPIWEMICFVLIVTAILVALFPRHLLEKVLANKEPSVVSVSYLKAFEKRYPQNYKILLALMQQQAQLGSTSQAEKNISIFRKMKIALRPDVSAQVHWTDYQVLKFKTYHAKENHKQLLQQLRVMGKALTSEPLTVQQLKTLAQDNLAYNQAAVSLKIYQDLMDKGALTTPEDLAQGGNIAMQNNAHRASAVFYMAAYNKAGTINDKRKYALEVIKVLWAGNYLQEALNFAIKLPEPVIDEEQILLYLAKLAAAANHPDIAQKYALKALLYEQRSKNE